MPLVEQYKRSLQAYKGHITRAINSCTSVASSVPVDIDRFESSITFLESKWPGYEQTYLNLETALLSEDVEVTSIQTEYYDVWDNYQNNLVSFKAALRTLVANTNATTSVTHPSVNSEKPRLPSVKLPTFSGEYTEFESFFDQFQAQIGSRSDLEPVTKLQYLKSQLRGSALDLIKDIPSIAANYKHAIDSLKETFGDDEKIKRSILTKIIEVPSPSHTKVDLESFRILLINLIKSLENKHDYSSCEWIIAFMFQRKLPKATIQQLYLKYSTNFFSLQQMSDGLRDLISHMDVVDNKLCKKITHESSSFTNERPTESTIGTYFSNKDTEMKITKPNPRNKTSQIKVNRLCLYCQDQHYTSECDKYATLPARQSRLLELDRCVRCISNKHTLKECNAVLHNCKRCEKGKHHTALCVAKGKDKSSHEPSNTQASTQQSVLSVKGQVSSKSTALPTATVEVCNPVTKQKRCTRVFFDQGSQCTFIKKSLVDKLKLKITGTIRLAMSGFLQTKDYEEYNVVRPVVRLGNRRKRITAVVLEHLPDRIGVPGLRNTVDMLHKGNIKLADKHLTGDVIDDIEIVIGGDFYGDFIIGITAKCNIKLCKSSGGHLIFGQIPNVEPTTLEIMQNAVVARMCTEIVPTEVKDVIEEAEIPIHKLWDLDTIGINVNKPPPDDCLTYQSFLDTVEFKNNQYMVRLPWKLNCPTLPTNYNMALGQLKSLTDTLKSRNELMIYHDLIQTQLDNDFVEIVPTASPYDKCHYLPHHGIKKDSTTTPLRIVFNCSAKRGGQSSLNDCLMTGPSLTGKLGDILLKFRINEFAYSADISKAFLRVGLQECDRDYTRFLWHDDPQETGQSPVTYRFKSVLFGATCSPFLLQATLDTHLKRSDNAYKALLSQNFYVDNFQGTTGCQQHLFDIYDNANMELSKANMPLRMWVSNNSDLNTKIENDFPNYQVPASTTILGLRWDVRNDKLSLRSPVFVDHSSLSKRKLLSLVSSVFDPLGLLSPITIRGKLLIREAWQIKAGWDETLPPSFLEQWLTLAEELEGLSSYEFPRMIGQDHNLYTLHVFCDASTHAYGAVAYLVSKEQSHLISSKARVAPMKSRTLPQLELTAIQVGTHLARYILETLGTLDIKDTFIWSDNEAALQWVKYDNSKIPYVKNRVAEIKEHATKFCFLYIPTSINPADFLSRGVTSKVLMKNQLWFTGPAWICQSDKWPKQKEQVVSINTSITETAALTTIFQASNISSLNKILNITNYVFKFLKLLKSSIELPSAISYWLRNVQQECYREEYEFLTSNNSHLSTSTSLVKNLGLYIDPITKLIHCRGRLHNSDMTSQTKFPILLPRTSWLTSLIIRRSHVQMLHGGVADTLASIREQYWIPKGRQVVKTILKKCIVCKTIEGRPMKLPGPPPLPKERVRHIEPFHTVGVDYTGAILIKSTTDDVTRKYYICLFTCATTRAVHLELAKDMSALTFLHLFRRFVARRSSPKIIISDNGSNFHATSTFLKALCNDPIVKAHFNNYQIEWKFIPPRAPWMGGFYERMVSIVKTCIRKVLFKRKITEDELTTVLAEIEMRVNNRPLTYIDDDINHPVPLTPSHLIYGRRLEPMPVEIEDKEDDPDYVSNDELTKRYSYICQRLKHWENIWKKEYLSSLRERFYGAQTPTQETSLKVGDVVIVQTEGARDSWPLGRITATHPDKAGNIRIMKVFSRGMSSLRTLDKLIPLELHCIPETSNVSKKDSVARESNRQAAIQAKQAIRNLSDKGLI